MFPSTNNGLESNNNVLKQNYTNRTRHSVPSLVSKLSDFLKDQVGKNKDQAEYKINHELLKEAEKFLDKNSRFYAKKDLSKSRTKYRTIIKEDIGILKGEVTHIAAVPGDETNPTDVNEFERLAAETFKRKTTLDYEDFDQFKSDSKKIYFVEHVSVREEICFVCSCETSMKGTDCLHTYATGIREEYLVKPSEIAQIGRMIRKKGNLCKNQKQRRF